MRRIANISVLIALLLCCALTGHSQDIEANGIYYNIISDTQVAVAPAYYDGANHYEGCIILPERVYCDGVNYDVAAIAPRAFWRSGVTCVQIPNSVTMIGEAAFADAEDLTDITLPLGLKAVSRYMLAGTAVTNLVLPEGVTDIEAGAFEDCARLQTIFLPYTLQRVGNRAFAYCNSLNEIYSDVSQPPLTMGDETFEGCNGLHVMVPDAATARRYQNDGVWGDEEQFTLWIDEGIIAHPLMEQENVGENWTALKLDGGLAYKIYGPDGYLVALTAADRYFLPIGAQSTDYLVVPSTLMCDEEDQELVATVEPAAIEEIEEAKPENELHIIGLDGTIYIQGDTHGLWTFIYDVYGNLWYERPSVNNWISLPGPRIYIVKVGDLTRKVFLN
jgi:hypothetical protein